MRCSLPARLCSFVCYCLTTRYVLPVIIALQISYTILLASRMPRCTHESHRRRPDTPYSPFTLSWRQCFFSHAFWFAYFSGTSCCWLEGTSRSSRLWMRARVFLMASKHISSRKCARSLSSNTACEEWNSERYILTPGTRLTVVRFASSVFQGFFEVMD